MYMKNDVIKALTVIRDKNPSRGAKRPREETQARKLNPLHGVIEWIDVSSTQDRLCYSNENFKNMSETTH